MKCKCCLTLAFFFAFACLTMSAQQQPEKPDVYEQAEMEADRLQRVLDLEDWQVFYVDSTLKHINARTAKDDRTINFNFITTENFYSFA